MAARSWRDYRSDNSDRNDKTPDPANFVPIVTTVNGIPTSVLDGVERLVTMAAPRLRSPEVWPEVVADAQRLVSEGWASTALSLGWGAIDLFGAVFDADGSADGDGLAVRLCGRKVLALCPAFATVSDGPGARSFLHRPAAGGARLLWDAGGGR